jgi:hypothetical protein
MNYKAENCNGASCTVNGVDFSLWFDGNGDWVLLSKYDETPLEQYAHCLRLADAPYGLIEAFGQSVAYEMVEAALKAM